MTAAAAAGANNERRATGNQLQHTSKHATCVLAPICRARQSHHAVLIANRVRQKNKPVSLIKWSIKLARGLVISTTYDTSICHTLELFAMRFGVDMMSTPPESGSMFYRGCTSACAIKMCLKLNSFFFVVFFFDVISSCSVSQSVKSHASSNAHKNPCIAYTKNTDAQLRVASSLY